MKQTKQTNQRTPQGLEETDEPSDFQEIDGLPASVWSDVDKLIIDFKVSEDRNYDLPLFNLARGLRRIELDLYARFSLVITAKITERWKEYNKRTLIADHDYHLELLDKLSLVRVPSGISPLLTALSKAKRMSAPRKVANFPSRFQWLVNLCLELQETAGEKPFYLDGRAAAKLLGIPHRTLASWLRVLCSSKLAILREVFKGRQSLPIQISAAHSTLNVPAASHAHA